MFQPLELSFISSVGSSICVFKNQKSSLISSALATLEAECRIYIFTLHNRVISGYMSPQRPETHPKKCTEDYTKEPALKHQELTEEHTESWLEYLMHNELQCES